MQVNAEAIQIVKELAEVRCYNAAGVIKGIQVKDQVKAHELVKRSRELLEKLKEEVC